MAEVSGSDEKYVVTVKNRDKGIGTSPSHILRPDPNTKGAAIELAALLNKIAAAIRAATDKDLASANGYEAMIDKKGQPGARSETETALTIENLLGVGGDGIAVSAAIQADIDKAKALLGKGKIHALGPRGA